MNKHFMIAGRQFVGGGVLIGCMMLVWVAPNLAVPLETESQGRVVFHGNPTEIGVTVPRQEVPSHVMPEQKPSRASPSHIGAIMALLATFQDAGVLPPEDSPLATQLIHGLIQLQSAFMKSWDPALRRFFSEAMRSYFFQEAQEVETEFRLRGWTSRTLEAVLLYQAYPDAWVSPDLDDALLAFHVTRDDLREILIVFNQARMAFLSQRRDIHEVYEERRREMPGA